MIPEGPPNKMVPLTEDHGVGWGGGVGVGDVGGGGWWGGGVGGGVVRVGGDARGPPLVHGLILL